MASRVALALALASSALAARFTVTERLLYERYTMTEAGYPKPLTGMSVNTISLVPSATVPPDAKPFSSTTYSGHYYDNPVAGVATVELFYSPGVLPASAYTTVSDYPYRTASAVTSYVQTVAYVAPTECVSQFTAVTTSTFSLPDEVTDQLKIDATSAFTSSNEYGYYGRPTTTVFATLASTITPTGAALSSDPYYLDYVQSCYSFTVYPQGTASPSSRFGGGSGSGSGSGNGNGNGNGNGDGNSGGYRYGDNGTACDSAWHDCGSGPKYWGIILAAVLPTVFLLGFLESLLWYRRLMTGKSTLRFGTVCWILLCPPLIFLTRHVPSRNEDDQNMLREQWKEKGFKRWGDWPDIQFRHRYPVEELGVHPAYRSDSEDKVMTAYYDGGRAYTRPQNMSQPHRGYAHGNGSNAPGIPSLPPRPRQRDSLPSVPEEAAQSDLHMSGGSGKGKAVRDHVQTGPESHVASREAQPGPEPSDPGVGPAPREDQPGPAPREADEVSEMSDRHTPAPGKHESS